MGPFILKMSLIIVLSVAFSGFCIRPNFIGGFFIVLLICYWAWVISCVRKRKQ